MLFSHCFRMHPCNIPPLHFSSNPSSPASVSSIRLFVGHISFSIAMSCEVIIVLSSSEDEAAAGGDGLAKAKDVNTRKRKKAPTGSGRRKVNKVEDDDDCCVLSFDPFLDEVIYPKRRLSSSSAQSPDDVAVVAERGQVACRDYPHSRHMCAKYPFNNTSHESYCLKCFCYVCDVAAPCGLWKDKDGGHCHASESHAWKSTRCMLRRCRAKNG